MVRHLLLVAVLITLHLFGPAALAGDTVINVASPEKLLEVLRSVQGGETIRLAKGDYGKVVLQKTTGALARLRSPVIITSEDVATPARFSSISMTGVTNLTFKNLVFDYVSTVGASQSASPFKAMSSANITFDSVIFDGDLAKGVNPIEDGYGTGRGLVVRKSKNITLQNCQFRNWYRAAAFGETNGLQVLNNEVTAVSSDGFDFAQVEDVVISPCRYDTILDCWN
jgi:Right handed beta helix region